CRTSSCAPARPGRAPRTTTPGPASSPTCSPTTSRSTRAAAARRSGRRARGRCGPEPLDQRLRHRQAVALRVVDADLAQRLQGGALPHRLGDGAEVPYIADLMD